MGFLNETAVFSDFYRDNKKNYEWAVSFISKVNTFK